MSKRKNDKASLPNPLSLVCKRFNRWRQTHPPRTRISEGLWSEAVVAARECGRSRTARVLGLDYYALKKRLADTPAANSGNNKDTSSFVELIPPPAHAECVIEIENGDGGKMRISLKGGDIPDLVSLSRSFFRVDV